MAAEHSKPYTLYQYGGLYFYIPAFLKVKSDIPDFFAKAKRGYATLGIEVTTNKDSMQSWKTTLSEPLGVNPMLDSRIIREGAVHSPLAGWERIIEHRVIAQPIVNFFWGLALCMDNLFLEVIICADGQFTKEAEDLWQKFIHSIRRLPGSKRVLHS